MRYRVEISADAERDIEEIWDYIVAQDGVARAERVLDGLVAVWHRLESFPERGNVPKELDAGGIDAFREVHFKPYRILYAIEGDRVKVLPVLDGRRDMETLLRQRLMR